MSLDQLKAFLGRMPMIPHCLRRCRLPPQNPGGMAVYFPAVLLVAMPEG